MNVKYKSKMSWTFNRKRAIMKKTLSSDVTLYGADIYGVHVSGFRVISENEKINKKERKIAKEY